MFQNTAVSSVVHSKQLNSPVNETTTTTATTISAITSKSNINDEQNVNDVQDVTSDCCDKTVEEENDSSTLLIDKKNDLAEIDESNVNFNLNKEQWQRRANLQNNTSLIKQNRHSEPYLQRQSHTPDLVMDLPLIGNCSPQETKKKSISVSANLSSDNSLIDNISLKSIESPTDPDSPEMTTAAETFAKQNQCTLKKNTKINDTNIFSETKKSDYIAITSPSTERKLTSNNIITNTTTSTFKPQLKSKPPLLKKPVFSVNNLNSCIRKDQDDFPT